MNNYDPNSAGLAAGILALIGALLIPIFIILIISIVGHWRVYEKAGKPGWACIIPIYNIIVLLEIVGKPVWWLVLFIIPCVNIVFLIWTLNLLSKSFGQSEGFTVGLVLLNTIFICILGFGKYQYLGPAGAPGVVLKPNNPFSASDYQDPVPPQA